MYRLPGGDVPVGWDLMSGAGARERAVLGILGFGHFGRALGELAGWVASGKIKYRETVTQGLENAPKAFIGLLKGENFGKQLVKL